MEKKDLALSFTLSGITTDEFAILEDSYMEGDQVNMGTFVNFGHNIDHHVIGIQVKFQFEQNEKPFLVISATCSFQLQEEAWKSLVDENEQKIVLPEGFASHLAVITVGTVRGILYEKTRETPYKDYLIPPINLTDLIQEDVVIQLKSDEVS